MNTALAEPILRRRRQAIRPVVTPRHAHHRRALWLLVALTLTGPACKQSLPASTPTLADLKLGDQLKFSGRWLMSVDHGAHQLESPPSSAREVIVAVHGYRSEGYEWIYPLQQFGASGARVYFYRWNYQQCPDSGARELGEALDQLLASDPTISKLTVFGHSYGGLITALMASAYDAEVALHAHLIAAPLAGLSALTGSCEFTGVTSPAADAPVTLTQWRTRKELDGVYRKLSSDPQVVELPGEVTLLPEEYQGNRLGHNRSISWVADQAMGGAPRPQSAGLSVKKPMLLPAF